MKENLDTKQLELNFGTYETKLGMNRLLGNWFYGLRNRDAISIYRIEKTKLYYTS